MRLADGAATLPAVVPTAEDEGRAAAVVLAAEALSNNSGASRLLIGEGLPSLDY